MIVRLIRFLAPSGQWQCLSRSLGKPLVIIVAEAQIGALCNYLFESNLPGIIMASSRQQQQQNQQQPTRAGTRVRSRAHSKSKSAPDPARPTKEVSLTLAGADCVSFRLVYYCCCLCCCGNKLSLLSSLLVRTQVGRRPSSSVVVVVQLSYRSGDPVDGRTHGSFVGRLLLAVARERSISESFAHLSKTLLRPWLGPGFCK